MDSNTRLKPRQVFALVFDIGPLPLQHSLHLHIPNFRLQIDSRMTTKMVDIAFSADDEFLAIGTRHPYICTFTRSPIKLLNSSV